VKKKKKAAAKTSKKPATRKAGPARPAAARAQRPAVAAAKPAPATPRTSQGGRSMANVRPLRDRILVRRLEEAEQKVGGIIVPDTAKEKPQQAEVVAVGSGRLLDNGSTQPLTLKAGDKVLVGKWAGTEVKIDGQEYLILKEDEILGVLS
jgi:chaperonin GroES